MINTVDVWNNHYAKDKSVLIYPDENLVRIINQYAEKNNPDFCAIDIGCGTGRHVKLLNDFAIPFSVGTDISSNSLEVCSKLYHNQFINADNNSLPFKNAVFDLAVCWGSLHYSEKHSVKQQIFEIHRILKNKGVLAGTLRSDYDTMLKAGEHCGNNTWKTSLSDLNSSIVSFFSESELVGLFSMFTIFEYGIIQRSPLGNCKLISHWYFRAVK